MCSVLFKTQKNCSVLFCLKLKKSDLFCSVLFKNQKKVFCFVLFCLKQFEIPVVEFCGFSGKNKPNFMIFFFQKIVAEISSCFLMRYIVALILLTPSFTFLSCIFFFPFFSLNNPTNNWSIIGIILSSWTIYSQLSVYIRYLQFEAPLGKCKHLFLYPATFTLTASFVLLPVMICFPFVWKFIQDENYELRIISLVLFTFITFYWMNNIFSNNNMDSMQYIYFDGDVTTDRVILDRNYLLRAVSLLQ